MQEKETPKTVLKSKNSSSPSNKVTVGIEDSGKNAASGRSAKEHFAFEIF